MVMIQRGKMSLFKFSMKTHRVCCKSNVICPTFDLRHLLTMQHDIYQSCPTTARLPWREKRKILQNFSKQKNFLFFRFGSTDRSLIGSKRSMLWSQLLQQINNGAQRNTPAQIAACFVKNKKVDLLVCLMMYLLGAYIKWMTPRRCHSTQSPY